MRFAGLATLVGRDREDAVKAAIREGLTQRRTKEGGRRLDNQLHNLLVRA